MLKEFNSAIILAGGKSSRMKFNKALVQIGEKTCMEIIIEKLKREFNELIIVTKNKNIFPFAGVKVVEDELDGYSPAIGLYSGLIASGSLYNYLIACDMPFISLRAIYELRNSIEKGSEVIAFSKDGFIQPFNAVYSKKLIPRIEYNLKKGEKGLFRLIKSSKLVELDIKNLPFKFNERVFSNINTMKDLELIKEKYCDID